VKGNALFAGLLLYLFSSVATAVESTKQRISFPMGTPEKPVVIEFYGAIYGSAKAVEVSASSNSGIARFINRVINANASKDKQAMLAMWSDRDKSDIDQLVSRPDLLEKNSALFRNIRSSKLVGYMEYGKYVICYVKHDIQGMPKPYLKTYPLVLKGEDYLLTNDLSDDFVFSKLSYNLGEYLWSKGL